MSNFAYKSSCNGLVSKLIETHKSLRSHDHVSNLKIDDQVLINGSSNYATNKNGSKVAALANKFSRTSTSNSDESKFKNHLRDEAIGVDSIVKTEGEVPTFQQALNMFRRLSSKQADQHINSPRLSSNDATPRKIKSVTSKIESQLTLDDSVNSMANNPSPKFEAVLNNQSFDLSKNTASTLNIDKTSVSKNIITTVQPNSAVKGANTNTSIKSEIKSVISTISSQHKQNQNISPRTGLDNSNSYHTNNDIQGYTYLSHVDCDQQHPSEVNVQCESTNVTKGRVAKLRSSLIIPLDQLRFNEETRKGGGINQIKLRRKSMLTMKTTDVSDLYAQSESLQSNSVNIESKKSIIDGDHIKSLHNSFSKSTPAMIALSSSVNQTEKAIQTSSVIKTGKRRTSLIDNKYRTQHLQSVLVSDLAAEYEEDALSATHMDRAIINMKTNRKKPTKKKIPTSEYASNDFCSELITELIPTICSTTPEEELLKDDIPIASTNKNESVVMSIDIPTVTAPSSSNAAKSRRKSWLSVFDSNYAVSSFPAVPSLASAVVAVYDKNIKDTSTSPALERLSADMSFANIYNDSSNYSELIHDSANMLSPKSDSGDDISSKLPWHMNNTSGTIYYSSPMKAVSIARSHTPTSVNSDIHSSKSTATNSSFTPSSSPCNPNRNSVHNSSPTMRLERRSTREYTFRASSKERTEFHKKLNSSDEDKDHKYLHELALARLRGSPTAAMTIKDDSDENEKHIQKQKQHIRRISLALGTRVNPLSLLESPPRRHREIMNSQIQS